MIIGGGECSSIFFAMLDISRSIIIIIIKVLRNSPTFPFYR